MKPRLIQTYLPDGSLEGIRIIELSESPIKAFVVPRLKLNELSKRHEINWPSLYFLVNSAENQLYIGESENFYHRAKNHDQSKSFWDLAIAIVSTNNNLEKSDVKYLESLAVEKAQKTAAMNVMNKTVPSRNNIHEFKVHTLEKILEDVSMIAESLGYSFFTSNRNDNQGSVWRLKAKKSDAKAEFRGDKFVLLSGSVIDKTYAPSWSEAFPKALTERDELFKINGRDLGDIVELVQNIPTRSPNHAAGIVAGRSINAWTAWKNEEGKSMDEVMRKERL